jgi:hypothetical protein
VERVETIKINKLNRNGCYTCSQKEEHKPVETFCTIHPHAHTRTHARTHAQHAYTMILTQQHGLPFDNTLHFVKTTHIIPSLKRTLQQGVVKRTSGSNLQEKQDRWDRQLQPRVWHQLVREAKGAIKGQAFAQEGRPMSSSEAHVVPEWQVQLEDAQAFDEEPSEGEDLLTSTSSEGEESSSNSSSITISSIDSISSSSSSSNTPNNSVSRGEEPLTKRRAHQPRAAKNEKPAPLAPPPPPLVVPSVPTPDFRHLWTCPK